MDYPRYQKAGLQVTRSLGESLGAECNARVKSRPKFGDRPAGVGAAAIRPLRAAVVSADDRRARHGALRPDNPYRCKAAKKVADVV
jgi:hypothetical protein